MYVIYQFCHIEANGFIQQYFEIAKNITVSFSFSSFSFGRIIQNYETNIETRLSNSSSKSDFSIKVV